MYKLLALDMDGTLLNEKKIITEEVATEITKLNENQVDVTLATGRFPASVWLHAKKLGLKCPLVALNGSVILDADTGEALKTTAIEKNVLYKLSTFLETEKVYFHFYGYNILVVEEINEMNQKWALGNVVMDSNSELLSKNYEDQLKHFTLKNVGKLSEFVTNDNLPIFKVTVINDDVEMIDRLYKVVKEWPELNITRTGRRRFDINASGVSKKSALIDVCQNRKIKSEEVVAVGDYDNDIEMLQWAGLGVAMGNGNNAVKNIANTTTLSNEENGVAEVIKRYF
jgi:Cof subfamily protein (haloacid dehalogenase superfamily)